MLTVQEITVRTLDAEKAADVACDSLAEDLSPRAFAPANGSPWTRGNSLWVGSDEALDGLGLLLGDRVDSADLALALRGLHSIDRTPVVPRPADGTVTTLDLRFSAPNSVSWVWAQADADLRVHVEHAMFSAANDMLWQLATNVPLAGGWEAAEGFAAALVLHVTVREAPGTPPPLLHVHCHLVGARAPRAALGPVVPAMLYEEDTTRLYGAVGRAVLAEKLRELGFGLEAGVGYQGRYFEITGVPRGLLRQAISVRATCAGPVQEPAYGR